jgi:hypothetical protein
LHIEHIWHMWYHYPSTTNLSSSLPHTCSHPLSLFLVHILVPLLVSLLSKSSFALPQASCQWCLPSLVCTTRAHPSISVKPLCDAQWAPHVAYQTSLGPIIIGRLFTGYGFIGPFCMFSLSLFCLRLCSFTFSCSFSPLPSDSTHCHSFGPHTTVVLYYHIHSLLFIWILDSLCIQCCALCCQ